MCDRYVVVGDGGRHDVVVGCVGAVLSDVLWGGEVLCWKLLWNIYTIRGGTMVGVI